MKLSSSDVSSLTFVFQVQHLFFEYRIRFSSSTFVLFTFDARFFKADIRFIEDRHSFFKFNIRFIEVQVQHSFYSSVTIT